MLQICSEAARYLTIFSLISQVPAAVREQMDVVAEIVGMDTETVSYVLGMFACYPLGLIMLQIPYGNARHLFSFLLVKDQ